ncbi:unnamed protein product [Adineta ricciae]|uniref:CCHC-type domain-containing protein n=1 Tax=Adineta ricciae TaxID=249248 RepID=A0A815LW41_ADIRI|nr:unnamed protein product [Adineta ricciae]CAF1477599.1 unnamed protein product [Adineta ricciae]
MAHQYPTRSKSASNQASQPSVVMSSNNQHDELSLTASSSTKTENSSRDFVQELDLHSRPEQESQKANTNIRTIALNSMNIPRQLATNNSTIPSIQYVINIDPLQKMKEIVKSFSGNPEDDASKWLASINHFFGIIRLPGDKDELCLQYGPAFLRTNSYRWWTETKSFVDSWSCFKQLFIEQFGEKNEYLLEEQVNQRKRLPNEPVMKYYYDMMELCNKCDPTMLDKQKIRKLILGLRLSLYQEAIKNDYSTPKEFLNKVQQLENIQKLMEMRQVSKDQGSYTSSHHYYDHHPVYDSYHYYPASEQPSPFDSHYQYQNNNSPAVPSNTNFQQFQNSRSSAQSNKSTNMKDIQCYQCRGWGHYARTCPQKNNTMSSSSISQQQKKQ